MPKYNFNLFSYFTKNKRSKVSNRPTKRSSTGKTRKQRGGLAAPQKRRMLVGKIYADWCGHCVSLKSEWAKLKNMVKHQIGRTLKNIDIEFVEIGDTEKNKASGKTVDGMIAEFNAKHMSKSAKKLALDGGYPTVFKHCHGKLEYYKGERSAKALYKWYTAGC